jgi:hypothetical protein
MLATIGLSTAAIAGALYYVISEVPTAAEQAKQELAKIQDDAKAIAKAAGDAEAAKRIAVGQIDLIANTGVQSVQNELKIKEGEVGNLEKSVKAAQSRINVLQTDKIGHAIETLDKITPAQFDALANTNSGGSLLLTTGTCPTGWVDVKEAWGRALVARVPPETVPSGKPPNRHPAKTERGTNGWTVTLKAANVPRMRSYNLTIPNFRLGNADNGDAKKLYEIPACRKGDKCEAKPAFANVSAVLTPQSDESSDQNAEPAPAEVNVKRYSVTVCRLP